jgi:hypothetical protein
MKYLFVLLLCSVNLFAQQKTSDDFTVIIHESTLNKVLKTIDSVSGSNNFDVMFISGTYYYTAKNFKINIRPDSSQFLCDVKVNVGPFKHKTKVTGHVKISYNKATNNIEVKVVSAVFELYTVVFGKKIHIRDIDLADNFKDPFNFEGPRSMSTDLDFTMPDGKIKKIYMQPVSCDIDLKWKEIVANFELETCDVPFNTGKGQQK